jgi:hypothetical protein
VLLVCLPLAAACATLSSAGSAIVKPAAIDYGEPVVYGQAARLVTGQPLYQPIDQQPLTVAAYTPLYYWAAAGLQAVVGPGFGPGRALSLACGFVSALLIGLLAGWRGGGVWVGVLGGLLFLALAFPGPEPPWLGLYRVDMLGLALSLGAVTMMSRARSSRAMAAAGLMAGLAVLCKQTFVAALIAGLLWQPRRAVLLVSAGLLTVALPCLLLQATTGAFVQNTVSANVNPFYAVVAIDLLKEFVKAQWLPLLLAGAYLWLGRPWSAKTSRLLVLYWLASSLSLVLIGKIGANHNYWIELAAATAILAGRGASCLLSGSTTRHGRVRAAGLVVLFGMQFLAPPGPLALAGTIRSDLRSLAAASPDPEFEMLIERVRHEPRDVLAEPMDTVVLAGRQVVLEPVIYSILFDTGRWQPGALVDRICSGGIGLVVLAYPLEVGVRMTDGLHSLWPAPIAAALQQRMQLEGRQAGRYVYVPRPRTLDDCPRQVTAAQLIRGDGGRVEENVRGEFAK